eukprot:2286881-Rhodomonas_salina.4
MPMAGAASLSGKAIVHILRQEGAAGAKGGRKRRERGMAKRTGGEGKRRRTGARERGRNEGERGRAEG